LVIRNKFRFSRIPTVKLRHARVQGKLNPKTITYRCPRDVTAILSEKFYHTKVKTFNPTETSVEVIPINSKLEVPVEKDTMYIAHLRADKDSLMQLGVPKERDHSTHEAQGKTAKDVILVRFSKTGNLLYSGKMPDAGNSHNLVGLSRHTRSLRYYTVCAHDPDDEIASGIRWSKTLDHQALATYRAGS